MERESFIFYGSFYEAIRRLPKDEQPDAYTMIMEYALHGRETDDDTLACAFFKLIKPQIDANNRRFENGKKGSEYGRLGGRPRKEKTAKKPQNTETKTPTKPQTVENENPKETPRKPLRGKKENPKETPNVNVNENVNENDTADAVSARVRANHGLHGNVILDDYAYEQLRQEMGESALKDYVNRLDGYLVKNPKFRGDHGSTILRWYNEDEAKRRAEEEKAKALETRKNYSAEELNAIFANLTAEDM